MLSTMDSSATIPHISHSSPAPAPQSSFSDMLLNSPDLESSPFPERQRSLPIDPFSNTPLPCSSANQKSNPIDDFDLDIISSRHGTNTCVRYPERKKFTTESEFIQKRDEFMRWWKTTTAAGKFGKKGTKAMRWGGSKHSQGWQHFIEVARLDDGTPHARCIHCEAFIDHPGRGNGTKTMIRHPNTRQCTYRDPQNGHTSIKDFLGKGSVSAKSNSIHCYVMQMTVLIQESFDPPDKYASTDLLS